MKPWKLLLALACLAPTTASAVATLPFRGLLYQSSGAAVADVTPAGRLVISNIGSSGQDGVSVDCLHMNGMRMELDGSSMPSDAGASVEMRYHCVGSSHPAPRSTALSFIRSPGHTTLFVDASEFASGPRQTVSLSRNGVVVYTTTIPIGTGVDVACDATGAIPNPTMSLVIDSHNIQARTGSFASAHYSLCYTVNGGQTWTTRVSVGGHDEDCDGISFTCALDDPDEDCDGISCDLSVTSPPGSSFSSLQCRSAQCRCLGGFVQASSNSVTLSADPPSSVSGKKLYVGNLPSVTEGGLELVRAPEMCVDGSGGGGGGGCGGAAMAMHFAAPSLYFDPATDAGASSRISIVGEGFSPGGSSLGAASGSLALTVTGSGLMCFPSYSGLSSDQVWVAVMSGGVEVARSLLPPGVGVPITPPPGGPLGMAINEKGLCHCKPKPAGTHGPAKADSPELESASLSASRGIAVDIRLPMHIKFQNVRVFSLGSGDASGDEMMCWTECSSGTCEGSFRVDVASELESCPSSGCSPGSLSLLDFPSAGGNPIGPDVAGSTALSSTSTCVTVPMEFSREDATPVRGFSVAFHLSPELAMCGAGVVEGDYLSSIGGTQMFTHDNGGGSFTVDCSILGPVCGATGDGTLFSLNLASTVQSSGTYGVITVDSVRVRDCTNHIVAADPGAPGYIPIVTTSPAALSGLSAVQVKSGNPPGGTTGIVVSIPAPLNIGLYVSSYKKGYGNYPLYDNGPAPGSVPTAPASSSAALSSGWTPVVCGSSCSSGACTSTCTATTMLDSQQARDFLYYCAFVRDLYGNESPVSNLTPGTLNYHLGDTSDGLAVCSGDNHVSLVDISLLGSHYGLSVSSSDAWSCLDVGPTTDFSVDGRPTTDGRIEFEDFILNAINYGVVSAPAASSRPLATAANASRLDIPALPAPGGTFDVGVMVDGAGDVQGLSAKLAYDAGVLEQVGVAPGALIEQQGRPGLVLSSAPGVVDAALLGTGPGLAGHGELARVTFRVKSAGDPRLSLASLTARDASNRPVAIAGTAGGAAIPARTALGFAYPNPFREAVAIQLSLHRAGPATIGVFDVAGRRVRTLVRGTQAAGARLVTWDGRDDSGLRLAPGAYIVRLETDEIRESRTIRLVR